MEVTYTEVALLGWGLIMTLAWHKASTRAQVSHRFIAFLLDNIADKKVSVERNADGHVHVRHNHVDAR